MRKLILMLLLSATVYAGNPFGGPPGQDDTDDEPGNSEFGHSHNDVPINPLPLIVIAMGLAYYYTQKKKQLKTN